MNSVVIIGASGHGKVIADIVFKSGDKVVGFLDDSIDGTVGSINLLGKINDYEKFANGNKFIVAIGNNFIRKEIVKKLTGVEWYTAIHPTAVISSIGTQIGEGSAICANAVVGPDVHIGKHCIINNLVDVDHDCRISNYTHVSPCAAVCGTCNIGSFCHIGAGVSIKNNISVCDNCVIGVGAVVVKDIIKDGVYVGVPAVRKNENISIHKL